MGSLALPPSGFIYVDANAAIYSVETQMPYWPVLQPLWQTAKAGNITVISSELLILETLVGPLRSGDTVLTSAYERLFASPEVRLLPISQAILREAAELRSSIPALRTPDAIHAATALNHGCALFVTNDRGFQHITSLPAVILGDLVKP